MWYQRTITLSEKPRGFHLITDEIIDKLSGLPPVETGLLHLLLLHTSASLTLNENCDPTVRADMERHFLKTVPDNAAYEHDYEGADDMPSHIKSSVLGVSLLLPVRQGHLQLEHGKVSGWESTVFTAVHVKSSRHYKGNDNDHFGITAILHGKTWRRAERPQRLESDAN